MRRHEEKGSNDGEVKQAAAGGGRGKKAERKQEEIIKMRGW